MKKKIVFSIILILYLSLTISCVSQSSFSTKEFNSCKETLNVTFKVIDTVEVDNVQ